MRPKIFYRVSIGLLLLAILWTPSVYYKGYSDAHGGMWIWERISYGMSEYGFFLDYFNYTQYMTQIILALVIIIITIKLLFVKDNS